MILYHISSNPEHNGEFSPRIPNGMIWGENDTIDRICVGETINGCLSSMPYGGSHLSNCYKEEDINLNNELYHNGYKKFKLFKIDSDKLNIPKKNILTPEELNKYNYCEDAHFNREHWITIGFKVPEEDQSVFIVEDFRFYRNEEGYSVIDMTQLNFLDKKI